MFINSGGSAKLQTAFKLKRRSLVQHGEMQDTHAHICGGCVRSFVVLLIALLYNIAQDCKAGITSINRRRQEGVKAIFTISRLKENCGNFTVLELAVTLPAAEHCDLRGYV